MRRKEGENAVKDGRRCAAFESERRNRARNAENEKRIMGRIHTAKKSPSRARAVCVLSRKIREGHGHSTEAGQGGNAMIKGIVAVAYIAAAGIGALGLGIVCMLVSYYTLISL